MKTEDELDKLNDIVILQLYKVFEDQFDLYFKFYNASLAVLSCGEGEFPFSTRYDCCMKHIEKSLSVIEANIIEHIREQLRNIFDERKKTNIITNSNSENLKTEFSNRLRNEISQMLQEL